MNNVSLIGRLTSKPELRHTSSNIPYTRFVLAVNRNHTDKDGNKQADFISVIAWRRQAENMCNYLEKGSLIAVNGSIQTGRYTDKNQKTVYTTDVIADTIQFLNTRRKDDTNQENKEKIQSSSDPYEEFGNQITIDDNFVD